MSCFLDLLLRDRDFLEVFFLFCLAVIFLSKSFDSSSPFNKGCSANSFSTTLLAVFLYCQSENFSYFLLHLRLLCFFHWLWLLSADQVSKRKKKIFHTSSRSRIFIFSISGPHLMPRIPHPIFLQPGYIGREFEPNVPPV